MKAKQPKPLGRPARGPGSPGRPSIEECERAFAEHRSISAATRALGVPRGWLDRHLPDLAERVRREREAHYRKVLGWLEDGVGWQEAANHLCIAPHGGRKLRDAVTGWARRRGIKVPALNAARQGARALRLRADGLGWKDVAERLGYASARAAENAARNLGQDSRHTRRQT